MRNTILAALAGSASAIRLYASSYSAPGENDGMVSQLFYQGNSLQLVSQGAVCGNQPTWLDTTQGGDKMYCVDEGWNNPNASLNTLQIAADGSFKNIAQLPTIKGPVSSQFYNGGAAVALAHYGDSAISTFTISKDRTTFTPLQNFTFFGVPLGPRPEQKDGSHPHQAVLDPTGRFMIFPDLGADVVRVYSIDAKTHLLKAQDSILAKPAYGPRHAVFWTPKTPAYGQRPTTYLFVIHELANRITTYRVDYRGAGICFTEIQDISTYGNRATPVGAKAAEIAVSPDNAFVTVSNRNGTIFNVDNPNGNGTKIPSDSLAVFKPSPLNGKLSFVQIAPSGGSFPRHFSYNKAGNMIAVANQNSPSVDIWARDVRTGKLGKRLASNGEFSKGGGINNVIWAE